MNPLARLNAFMAGYDVQNYLFIGAIGVAMAGMVSGLLTITYLGSSWVLGSLLSPVFRTHKPVVQMAIGIVSGAAFTYLYWGIKGLMLG